MVLIRGYSRGGGDGHLREVVAHRGSTVIVI